MALNLSVQSRAEMVQNILNLTQLRYAKRNSSLVKIVSLCVLILLLLTIIIALHRQQQSRQFASAASTTATLEAETATFASPVSRATDSAGNYIQFNQPINTSTGTVFDGVNVDMCLINPNSPDYVKNAQGQDLIDIAYHLVGQSAISLRKQGLPLPIQLTV
jgi:hypothetical protein